MSNVACGAQGTKSVEWQALILLPTASATCYHFFLIESTEMLIPSSVSSSV